MKLLKSKTGRYLSLGYIVLVVVAIVYTETCNGYACAFLFISPAYLVGMPLFMLIWLLPTDSSILPFIFFVPYLFNAALLYFVGVYIDRPSPSQKGVGAHKKYRLLTYIGTKLNLGMLFLGIYLFAVYPASDIFGFRDGDWIYLWLAMLDDKIVYSPSTLSTIWSSVGLILNILTVYWLGIFVERFFSSRRKSG